jgi:hypothetical protein
MVFSLRFFRTRWGSRYRSHACLGVTSAEEAAISAFCPPKAHIPHQPGDRAASGAEALPPQLTPNLTHAIDAEVLLEYAPDLDLQIGVAAKPVGQTGGIGSPGEMGMISRRGDRQNLADRLDPVGLTMIVDEGNHGLNRRSSSACAK